jgi:ATP-binding cassette subfamily B protein
MKSLLKLYSNLKKYIPLILGAMVLLYLQVRANLSLPSIMSNIINNGIIKGDTNYIWQEGTKMLLISAGGIAAAISANFLATRTSMGLGRDIREKLFSHIESLSLPEFNEFGASTLLTRTTNDVVQIQQTTQMLIMMLANATFTCIDALILAYNASPELTKILYVAIPIVIVAIALIIPSIMRLFLFIQTQIDRLNKVIRENIIGVRVIRAFSKTEYEKKRFDNANRDVTNTYIRANKIIAVLLPLMMIGMNLASVAIIWFGAKGIDNGTVNVGAMVAFLQYALMILISIMMLSMLFIMIPRAAAASNRIVEVLETEPSIKDPVKPAKVEIEKGYIVFENVSFKYSNSEEPVLCNINFEAKPGETIGILGTTGSGKSTLVNLIPRFYDPTEGRILIDGVDIRELTQENLRKRIGYVPQRAVLFSGTIKENIKMGNENATDEEVRHAAIVAQADEFISKLPDGYDTYVAEGGTNFSGGQKQRIAIARAIVKKPEIYVFDDCFSALDFRTEASLRRALNQETENATVIIVGQRVASLMNADKIIMLDEGRIACIGTHKELMKSCDIYREIVNSQLSEEDLVREGL